MIWVRETAHAVRDEQQRPVVLIVCEDITSVKVAEHALRESEEFTDQIVESSTDCIKVLDLDGRIQFMNDLGRKMLEIEDASSIQNKSWLDFWEGDYRQAAQAALDAARSGGSGKLVGPASTTSGTRKWWDVRVTPILDNRKRPMRLLAISR